MRATGDLSVQLIDHNLSDAAVVRAARVSVAGDRDRRPPEDDRGLIRFLMRERHGSPFEHGAVTFRVEAPLYVAAQWMRHRAGHSYNMRSGRYTRAEDAAYLPRRFRRQTGKPGAYTFTDAGRWRNLAARLLSRVAYRAAWWAYRGMLAAGVAREQARGVLPHATMTAFYWTANPRAVMHWHALRADAHAQGEIRMLADQVGAVMAGLMPDTWAAYLEHGVAP